MVIKFNPEGRVMMTIGPAAGAGRCIADAVPRPDPRNPGKYIFNRPTDVGWDADGNIFMSDGYGNSRIVKYDKNGSSSRRRARKGSEPGQLNLPHSLAMDAKGNAYVADRSNRRIEVFDNDLKFKTIYDNVGTPWEVCISPGPHQYLYSSNSFPDTTITRSPRSPAKSTRWSWTEP